METLRYCSLNVNVPSSLQEFADTPHMIGDPGVHRRCNAERFVNSTKIVERVPQHEGCPVVLPLARKRICQSSESAVSHAKGEIRALHYRSTDSFRIRISAVFLPP